MSARSRNKGARVEREIAAELHALTGVTFSRNLEQVRSAAHGDLIADDPDWPFSIEVKSRATGNGCAAAWQAQAVNAAALAGKIPVVVVKYDRRPVRVSVPLKAIHASLPADEWAEISLPGLAYLAREIMAECAE